MRKDVLIRFTMISKASYNKGGCDDLDDLCSTCSTVAVGVSDQLHDGRIHSYSARRSNHCVGTGAHSETMTLIWCSPV